MSRTESVEAPELLLPARAHRPVLVLPEDPSDDELLRHWTLSEADTREEGVSELWICYPLTEEETHQSE